MQNQSNMKKTILDVRNLKVEFTDSDNTFTAVNGIDFQLKRGEILGIVGESGSGKSVTSLAIMRLIRSPGRISHGEILFYSQKNGESIDLLALSTEEMQLYRGNDISMIFQEPMNSLNPVYTIGFQLLEVILRHKNITAEQAKHQVIKGLQEVKLLPSDEVLEEYYINTGISPQDKTNLTKLVNTHKAELLGRYPHQLSGGQLQRVMIAMAIACNPLLLIADEPTTALDVTVQASIINLMRELRQKREIGVIFITHDLGLITEVADRVAVMYKGEIVEYGNAREVFTSPQHPYTMGLIACRPTLDSHPKKLLTVFDYMSVEKSDSGEVLIEAKLPASPLQVTPKEREQRLTYLRQQPALLEVQDLKVGFPVRGILGKITRYHIAVNSVSFDVKQGETLGLVGESGCGKTTIGRTLLGLLEPMAGQIIFEGKYINQLQGKSLKNLRREMQIIFQNPFTSLNPRLNVGDIVTEPFLIHSIGKTKKARKEMAAFLLERVGLNAELMKNYPHEFSGGEKQRISIARSLALNPKFIICDESVSALDVSVQAQVLNLLKELQTELGLTYIFISHDLSVVKYMSDRILVMNHGRIVEQGVAEEVYCQPQQAYTQNLIASIPTGNPEHTQKIKLRSR